MKGETVTVLDLGSTQATCLAAAIADSGEIEVRAHASVPCRGLRRGVLTDLDEASRSIDAAARKVQQDLGQEVESLVVGVSGGHLEGLNAQGFKPIVPRGRHITHQDVLEVINHSRSVVLPPDREQIQALPREFRVDGQRDVRRPVGMSGGKLEVVTYLVTGQTSAMQNLEKAVQMCGRKVEQIVLSPLASGIGVLTQDEMELGAVVVDLGGGTTDLAVFTHGTIAFSASIPVGGGHVTSDLINLLRTSPEEAERLKTVHGSAVAKLVDDRESVHVQQIGQSEPRPMQRRVMCEIIEARMREIARLVAQQVEKSGLVGQLPGGLVLTGGASRLVNADRLFEDTMRHLKCRIAQPALPARFGPAGSAASALGLARFTLQCLDEVAPASGVEGWKDRVRILFSSLRGK